MGQNFGVAGVYGLFLPAWSEKLGPLYSTLVSATARELAELEAENKDVDIDIALDKVCKLYTPRVCARFKQVGIQVPDTAALLYTDVENVRPGDCETPPNCWILGFSVFTHPDRYPELHESFTRVADFHTWVWYG